MIETACPGHAVKASGHRLHVASRVGDQAMQLKWGGFQNSIRYMQHVFVETLHNIDVYILNLRSNAPTLTNILHKFCHLLTSVPFFHHHTSKDKFDSFPLANIDWGKPFIYSFIVQKLTDFSSNIGGSCSTPTIQTHPDQNRIILGKLGHKSTTSQASTLQMAIISCHKNE